MVSFVVTKGHSLIKSVGAVHKLVCTMLRTDVGNKCSWSLARVTYSTIGSFIQNF